VDENSSCNIVPPFEQNCLSEFYGQNRGDFVFRAQDADLREQERG